MCSMRASHLTDTSAVFNALVASASNSESRDSEGRRRTNLFNFSRVLLLPTAAQGLVKLHQSDQFVCLGLRQSQLGGKGIVLIGQYFQVIRGPRLKTHFREPCRILG